MRRSALCLPFLCLTGCVPWTLRPLNEGHGAASAQFDANRYADAIWASKLLPAIDKSAVDLRDLLSRHTLKPGDSAAVRGAALVVEVNLAPPSGSLLLDLLPADGHPDAALQTGPEMRGTSLRDATSIISFSQPDPARAARRVPISELLFRLRALLALIVLSAVFSALSPAFLGSGNLVILIRHVAINAILAVGMTFVILTGGIDLSVGSVAGLAGIVAGGLIGVGLPLPASGVAVYFQVWLVIVIALLAGTAVGAHTSAVLAEAFETYLGWETYHHAA